MKRSKPSTSATPAVLRGRGTARSSCSTSSGERLSVALRHHTRSRPTSAQHMRGIVNMAVRAMKTTSSRDPIKLTINTAGGRPMHQMRRSSNKIGKKTAAAKPGTRPVMRPFEFRISRTDKMPRIVAPIGAVIAGMAAAKPMIANRTARGSSQRSNVS